MQVVVDSNVHLQPLEHRYVAAFYFAMMTIACVIVVQIVSWRLLQFLAFLPRAGALDVLQLRGRLVLSF